MLGGRGAMGGLKKECLAQQEIKNEGRRAEIKEQTSTGETGL